MLKMVIALYILLTTLLYAEPVFLESGNNKNTLVELYTSEGCSSCPPAEEFLNNLKDKSELWKKLIPVAFHVDYWDYIGWKDRFAKKEFGQRQSHYASLKRASTVYTPAFIINGLSWRPGLFSRSIPVEKSSAGNLVVSINKNTLQANYTSVTKNHFPLKLNIAILGMGLTSHIQRGENQGRDSEHEFVVVGFKSVNSNNLKWNTTFPELHNKDAKEYATAIWVSEVNNPTPIQVVGSLLPGYKLASVSK